MENSTTWWKRGMCSTSPKRFVWGKPSYKYPLSRRKESPHETHASNGSQQKWLNRCYASHGFVTYLHHRSVSSPARSVPAPAGDAAAGCQRPAFVSPLRSWCRPPCRCSFSALRSYSRFVAWNTKWPIVALFLIMVVDSWNYVMEVAGRFLCKTYKRIFRKTQMNLLVPQNLIKNHTHYFILFNQY